VGFCRAVTRAKPRIGGSEGTDPSWAAREGSKECGGGGEGRERTFLFLPLRNLVPIRSGLAEEEAPKGEELKCLDSTCLLPPSSSEGQCDPEAHPYAEGMNKGP